MKYAPPNGVLHDDPEHGLIWTTQCRKCGTTQRIRAGYVSLDEARAACAIIDNQPRECPWGFHVELGGWKMLWSLDLMLEAIANHHNRQLPQAA